MEKFLKNLWLLAIALVLSGAAANYFGFYYDKISPQYGSWIGSGEDSVFFVGFLSAYIFFIVLIFRSFGVSNRNKYTLWFLVPVVFLFVLADFRHIYFPLSLGLIAFGLSIIISKVFKLNNQ